MRKLKHLLLLLCITWLLASVSFAQSPVSSIFRDSFNGNSNKQQMVAAANKLGMSYLLKGQLDSAFYYYSYAAKNSVNNPAELARSYAEMGNILSLKGMTAKAIDTLLMADKILENSQVNDKAIKARLYKNLGDHYSRNGMYERSLFYSFKSCELYEALGDYLAVAKNRVTVGINYSQLKDFRKSIQYYNMASPVFEKANNMIALGSTYLNVASDYLQIANADSAAYFVKIARDIFSKANFQAFDPTVNYLETRIDILKGNYQQGISRYFAILKEDKEQGMEDAIGTDYQAIGDAYHKANQLDSSIFFVKLAAGVFEKSNMLRERTNSYFLLVNNYNRLNRSDSVEKYLSLYTQSLEALYNKDVAYARENLEVQYQTSVKEAKIAQQRAELSNQKLFYEASLKDALIARQQSELANQRLSFSATLKDAEIQKQQSEIKSNRISYELQSQEQRYLSTVKEATIRQQQSDLKYSRRQRNVYLATGIMALIAASGFALAFRRIRNQRNQIQKQRQEILHNNRNSLQQLIAIFSRQAEDDKLKESSIENQERLYTLTLLNKLLYEQNNNSKVSLQQYLQQLMNAKQLATGNKVQIRVNADDVPLKSNQLKDIGLIVNELTTNSIKYAFVRQSHPEIVVSARVVEDRSLAIEVKDNGTGFLLQAMKDQSFGLRFVKDLVSQHHGSVIFTNEQGSKTVIQMRIR